jgi:SAM-dependent methyltransferase
VTVTPPKLASSSGGLPSAVRWAQLLLEDRLRPGDAVVDATAGNGHDSLFLARQIGATGHLWAFDVQSAAIAATQARLLDNGIPASSFTLVHAGHEQLIQHLPSAYHGQLAAVMFNLGYLPGSDKSCITHTATTLQAIAQALQCLAPSGLLTIAVYPGHPGGADEAQHIAHWAASLDPRGFEVQHLRPVNRAATPPECWVIWKRSHPPQ